MYVEIEGPKFRDNFCNSKIYSLIFVLLITPPERTGRLQIVITDKRDYFN